MRRAVALALTVTAAACATGGTAGDDIDARRVDAPIAIDAADTPIDAAATDAAATDALPVDALPVDALPVDALPVDALPVDAPVTVDAPTTIDASTIDAGTTVPDTCAQARDLTAAATGGTGVTVTGDTTGAADDIRPASACTGYLPDGPDHVYVVNLTAGQTVTATATATTAWDISLELVTPCTLTPTCLAGADSGTTGGETAMYTATAATTVFIAVDGYNPGVQGPYSLLVRIQ